MSHRYQIIVLDESWNASVALFDGTPENAKKTYESLNELLCELFPDKSFQLFLQRYPDPL